MRVNTSDAKEYFLLSGEVELRSFDDRIKQVKANTESAKTAIALLQPRKYTVTALVDCEFLVVPQKVVETLMDELPKEKDVTFSVSDLHSGHELEDIEKSFYADLAGNNLALPSLPEVALRIRNLLDQPDVSAGDVANALKSDPAITLKLLKTCNSALYRTANEIRSPHDAIVRLGFNTTRQLVTIFAIKDIFHSKNKYLQDKLRFLWDHSREVAAMSYVLAKKTPGMDPEFAMLAGLLQDIGALPVLSYIEKYPQFMKTDTKIDEITKVLKGRVGATLLERWGMAPALVEVAANTENWHYDNDRDGASYTDVAIVAQLHAMFGKAKSVRLPRFSEVPAFSKLGDGGLTPEESQNVLNESHQQIDELKALLGNDNVPVLS